jgi:DNA-binding transcriptional LysR family regulator
MRLEQLTYLTEVAQCGTITKAAERLNISQPNITTALKGLESELGVRLFDRSKNGMTLTQSGEDACKIAFEILERVQQLRLMKGQLSVYTQISLKIATIPSLNNSVMSEWMHAYQKRYPASIIYNTEGSSAKVMQEVLNGNVDIGFVSMRKQIDSLRDLTFQKICDTYPYVCLGSDLAESLISPIQIQDLHDFPFFSQNPDYICHTELLNRLKHDKKHSNVIFYSSSHSAIKAMVKANQGAAIFSSVALAGDDDVASGKIVPFRVTDYYAPSTLYVVYRKNYPCLAEVQEFIRIAKDRILELLEDYFPDNL